jgi:hypothetical protein
MIIREEREGDFDAIRVIVAKAFKDHPFSNQREPLLIDALRRAGALTIALVAEEDGAIAGHIAFSPVQIEARFQNLYGLGPLAISPERQRAGKRWFARDSSGSPPLARAAALCWVIQHIIVDSASPRASNCSS